MSTRLNRALIALAAVLLVAGCASPAPDQTTTWRDPGYAGPGFKKVFVVGLNSRDLQDQQGFENLLVSSFKSVGVVAVPGWQYVPTDRTPDQATMRDAVLKSGADAALLVRMSGFTEQSQIVGTAYPVGPGTLRRLVPACGGGQLPGRDDLRDAVRREHGEAGLDVQRADVQSGDAAAGRAPLRQRDRRTDAVERAALDALIAAIRADRASAAHLPRVASRRDGEVTQTASCRVPNRKRPALSHAPDHWQTVPPDAANGKRVTCLLWLATGKPPCPSVV